MSDPALLREGLRDRYAFERELGREGLAAGGSDVDPLRSHPKFQALMGGTT